MRDLELKIEIKTLKELLNKSGAISRRKVENMIKKRVDELIYIEDLSSKVLLEKEIKWDDISVRAINCLKANDIRYGKDLVSAWPLKKCDFKNLGDVTIREIELYLRRNNLIT